MLIFPVLGKRLSAVNCKVTCICAYIFLFIEFVLIWSFFFFFFVSSPLSMHSCKCEIRTLPVLEFIVQFSYPC